jgi:hypothetical protein
MQINSGEHAPAQASAMGGFRIPVLLALFAMSALLLAPVCDALEAAPSPAGERVAAAPQDHHDSEACCDALPADGGVIPSVTLASFAQGDAGTALEAPALPPRLRPSTHAATGPPRLLPRSLRYHARTARILA